MIRSFLRRNHLFLVNVTSASGLLVSSDLIVQIFYEKKDKLNEKRVWAALTTGTVMGVEGHFWYSFLDRKIFQTTWRSVLKKTFFDQALAAPFYTLTYIVGTSILEGRTSYEEVSSDVQRNFVPLYLVDCAIFIPIQIINFKYVPSFYRVPFFSFFAFIFDIFISAYKHKHEGVQIRNVHK